MKSALSNGMRVFINAPYSSFHGQPGTVKSSLGNAHYAVKVDGDNHPNGISFAARVLVTDKKLLTLVGLKPLEKFVKEQRAKAESFGFVISPTGRRLEIGKQKTPARRKLW